MKHFWNDYDNGVATINIRLEQLGEEYLKNIIHLGVGMFTVLEVIITFYKKCFKKKYV